MYFIDFGMLIAILGIVFLLCVQLVLVRLLTSISQQVKELVQNVEKSVSIEQANQGISNDFLENLGFKTDKMKQPLVHVYHVSSGKKEIVPICK